MSDRPLNTNRDRNTTNTHKTKKIVLVVSPLAVALIFATSTSTLSNRIFVSVYAEPPDPCFTGSCNNKQCSNNPDTLSATCCWVEEEGTLHCQTCHVQLPSGDYDCDPVMGHKANSGEVNIQPTNIAPPKTKTCPDGSVINTDDKCPPVTQGPADQGTTTQSPTNDNTDTKHHKGSELSQLPPLTQDNNNNNDNKPSKHHKGGDTLTPQSSSIDQGTQ